VVHANSIARFQQDLPLSTLEIELLPFVGLIWLVYFFWWKEPLNVDTSTIIAVENISKGELIRQARATLDLGRPIPWWRPVPRELHERGWDFCWMDTSWNLKQLKCTYTIYLILSNLLHAVKRTMVEQCVANWYRPAMNEADLGEWGAVEDLFIFLTGLWLYSIPLLAWNFEFPTLIELLLWKIVCLSSVGGIVVFVLTAFCLRPFGSPSSILTQMHFYLIVALVALMRLYGIVEVFIGLRSCPKDIYSTVNWSNCIPHVLK
jgi:hypothetical protein